MIPYKTLTDPPFTLKWRSIAAIKKETTDKTHRSMTAITYTIDFYSNKGMFLSSTGPTPIQKQQEFKSYRITLTCTNISNQYLALVKVWSRLNLPGGRTVLKLNLANKLFLQLASEPPNHVTPRSPYSDVLKLLGICSFYTKHRSPRGDNNKAATGRGYTWEDLY